MYAGTSAGVGRTRQEFFFSFFSCRAIIFEELRVRQRQLLPHTKVRVRVHESIDSRFRHDDGPVVDVRGRQDTTAENVSGVQGKIIYLNVRRRQILPHWCVVYMYVDTEVPIIYIVDIVMMLIHVLARYQERSIRAKNNLREQHQFSPQSMVCVHGVHLVFRLFS